MTDKKSSYLPKLRKTSGPRPVFDKDEEQRRALSAQGGWVVFELMLLSMEAGSEPTGGRSRDHRIGLPVY